jgi:pimeloyl-ACP methyl ester carboxylesterase
VTEIVHTRLDVPGGTLAALRATPDHPRGVVIALHGGSYEAAYWHHPAAPDASLLTLGALLGFDIVALDRAGHAGSVEDFPDGLPMAAQLDQIFALAGTLGAARGLPVFLIGHSLGASLALMAAADPRAEQLAGAEGAGVPVRFPPEQDAGIRAGIAATRAAGKAFMAPMSRDMTRAMYFAADDSFDPAVLDDDPARRRAAVIEIVDVVEMPQRIAAIAAGIRIPVRWTFAGEERSSLVTPEIVAEAEGWTAGNPGTRIIVHHGSGHNISLHRSGRAYHLAALAFFEEQRAARR